VVALSLRIPVPQNFLDLVSNTNTHAARTRTGTHEGNQLHQAEAGPGGGAASGPSIGARPPDQSLGKGGIPNGVNTNTCCRYAVIKLYRKSSARQSFDLASGLAALSAFE